MAGSFTPVGATGKGAASALPALPALMSTSYVCWSEMKQEGPWAVQCVSVVFGTVINNLGLGRSGHLRRDKDRGDLQGVWAARPHG